MVEAEGHPVGLGSAVSWRTARPACARCSHHCQDSELQLGLHLSTPGPAAPWASEKPGEAHGPGDTQSPAPHPLRPSACPPGHMPGHPARRVQRRRMNQQNAASVSDLRVMSLELAMTHWNIPPRVSGQLARPGSREPSPMSQAISRAKLSSTWPGPGELPPPEVSSDFPS